MTYRLFSKLFCVAGAVAIMLGAASAHRMWLLPSTFTLSGSEQWVTVDGAISNDLFFPNHVPLPLNNIEVTAPDGGMVNIENGATGKFRSTFDVKLDQQGTYRISEVGGVFFAMWKDSGETVRQRGALEELRKAGKGKEGFALARSSRRIETFVTLGALSEGAFAITGKGLELKPLTHPNDVYVGEEARFQLLRDGAPAAGLDVEIVKGNDRYRTDPGIVTIKTDTDGNFAFTPAKAGRYWMSASVEGEGALGDGTAIDEYHSYAATIEAL